MNLLDKYNIPAPRYTSYPTVPYWQETAPTTKEWGEHVRATFSKNSTISLYIHLPFCESLCTYCGCNKRITKNHQVETPYLQAVLKEWQLYLDLLPSRPVIGEIHLGGGTPTFFSPESLDFLLSNILKDSTLADDYEFGFEAHPDSTSRPHLEVLAKHGFKRISIGIQDFDNEILRIINRQQSYEQVEQTVRWARELGYTSINFDLIFGLPLQTTKNIIDNIEKVKILRPDRIAFYSYAHVPWIKPSQRAYSVADLPQGKDKRALYELGKAALEAAGYIEIGLDHFALPTDNLYLALENGNLHRNFMGYTPHDTQLNLALGASSISDSWGAYVQNEKKIETYESLVNSGELPIVKGHLLTESDKVIRQHILNLICQHETAWATPELQHEALYAGLERLKDLEADGLIVIQPFKMQVTEIGKTFIRNICMALDERYWAKTPEGALFSAVV